MKSEKLSPNMLAWLHALAAGRDPTLHFRTRSEYGGASSTRFGLSRRGLIDQEGNITAAGRSFVLARKK